MPNFPVATWFAYEFLCDIIRKKMVIIMNFAIACKVLFALGSALGFAAFISLQILQRKLKAEFAQVYDLMGINPKQLQELYDDHEFISNKLAILEEHIPLPPFDEKQS